MSKDDNITQQFTLAEVEELLWEQGCGFDYNHGLAPGTSFSVSCALRQIDEKRRGVFFYYGAPNEPVSRDFLLELCNELKIKLSVFGLDQQGLAIWAHRFVDA